MHFFQNFTAHTKQIDIFIYINMTIKWQKLRQIVQNLQVFLHFWRIFASFRAKFAIYTKQVQLQVNLYQFYRLAGKPTRKSLGISKSWELGKGKVKILI